MKPRHFPQRTRTTICFAHVAYRLGERFGLRNTGINAFEVRSVDALQERIPEADVLVVSGLWRNELLARTSRLAFIQSVSAGTDQFRAPRLPRRACDSRALRVATSARSPSTRWR
jgi:phosphoglycerate dehydrogenase-like enzyme